MKIKLDENLPTRLVDLLSSLGHEVDTVPAEGLTGRPDEIVWEAAQEGSRFLITQDLDFSDVRKYAPGGHDGVMVVRLRQPGREALVKSIFQQRVDIGPCRLFRSAHGTEGQNPSACVRNETNSNN